MARYLPQRAMAIMLLISCLAVKVVYTKRNDPRVLTPEQVEDECPPCELLFSKLERTGLHGKPAQDISVAERGEPKSGTGVLYYWASAALIRACDYLQELYGQGSCQVKSGHSSGDDGRLVHGHSMLFEPALGGSDARCSCETVDRVSIIVTEFNKHRLPVNKSCAFRHSGGIGIGKIQGREAAKDSPCTFLDGSQVTNYHELWLCMHEAGCEITDDWLQMAVFRDPRPAIVSTFFYLETHLGMDVGDLDAFVARELPIMCQWLAARYIFFVGILGDESIEFWYSDAMEDPLAWHYDWLYFVGLQLPFDTVEAMAHAAAADDLDFKHKSVDLHPGEEATTGNGVRRFEDEVSSETVKLSDAILRAWLPPVLMERCGVMP